MKVDAYLLFDVERLEEEVHQKRLAAADAAPEVNTLAGQPARVAAPQQPEDPAAPRRSGTQAVLQLGQLLNDGLLCDVAGVPLSQQAFLIGLANTQDCSYPFFAALPAAERTPS